MGNNMEPKFDVELNQQQSTVWQWLRITVLAVINVLILAAFSAYFNNQSLSLLDAISIIADSMSIVLGLLGIWFFFLSEKLNRSTALNLERTTSTVNDLRTQMWEMIQKTFNTFINVESREKVQESRHELEQLIQEAENQGEGGVSPQLLQALDKLSNRLDTIENKQEALISIRPPTTSSESNEIPSGIVRDVIFRNLDRFPMEALEFWHIFREEIPKNRNMPATKYMTELVEQGFLEIVEPKEFISGMTVNGRFIINPGKMFWISMPESLKKKYKEAK